tara:strand:+ start:301 stop:663 length:363 start_codon:yes stop_codon:yes gene_type:complete
MSEEEIMSDEDLSSEEHTDDDYHDQNYVTITDKMYIDNQNLWTDVLKEKNNALQIEKENIEISLKLKHFSKFEEKYISLLQVVELFRFQRFILVIVNIVLSKNYWLPYAQMLITHYFPES